MGTSTINHSTLIGNYTFRREKFSETTLEEYETGEYYKVIRNLSRDSYRMGISKLFYKGRVEDLTAEFRQAALYRKELEDLVADKELKIRWYALVSNYLPLLSGFVAGGISLVNQIDLKLFPYLDRYEFEEDYFYGKFFYTILYKEGKADDSLKDFLSELEELEELESTRYALITALLNRDSEAFDLAMDAFITEYNEFYDGMTGALFCDYEAYSTERFLSIEAVAWLKLAKINEMEVSHDYFVVPLLIRSII